MVKQAECESYHLKYLTEIVKGYKFAMGLILGQVSAGKFNIIHFAKTPVFQPNPDKKSGKTPKAIKNISEVNENWIADHANQTAKMLPGGMYIMGIFVVCDEELLSPVNPKIKTILSVVEKQIKCNKLLFDRGGNEKIILQYSPKAQKYLGKSYDLESLNVQPVEFKFLDKPTRWVHVESLYQVDRNFYIKASEKDGPLREHISVILDKICNNLHSSKILFDNELKDPEDTLENIGKKKTGVSRSKSGSKHSQPETENKNVQVSIFEPCFNNDNNDTIQTQKFGGQIRVVGEVVSRVCLNGKSTIEEASKAVKNDILKSLATRLEMHWDSLTEEELSEDVNSVHEPPRRVLITLPESTVTISDYLFPGEGPEDAKVALEELLDIPANSIQDILDLEPQADITQYYKSTEGTESEDNFTKISATDTNKFMYLVGLVTALIVLVISLIIHFYA